MRIRIRRAAVLTTVWLLAISLYPAPAALADASDPGGTFADDDGNVHEGGIEAIAAEAITLGCNPPGNYLYCPGDPVTRGEMATFLARALGLPASSTDHFSDDNSSVFQGAINRVADAGITEGCNPPANTRFCPTRTMTRGEMAAFMARAFSLPVSTTNHFSDDNGHLFEGAINRIADANITVGCNPPSNTQYCPDEQIERDQMATFLTRALGLTSMRPPAPTRVPVLSITDGDTFRVRLSGVNEPLRLIGINTPEVGDECAAEATAALRTLVDGRTVRIDIDVSNRDSFGRLLRYTFRLNGTMVNAELVELGWAAATDFPPDSKYASLFAGLEAEAQAANRGQWGPNCAGQGGGGGGGNCDPSYPDVCIPPPPPDLDCTQISHRNFRVTGSDPHGFDGDNDGIGCET